MTIHPVLPKGYLPAPSVYTYGVQCCSTGDMWENRFETISGAVEAVTAHGDACPCGANRHAVTVCSVPSWTTTASWSWKVPIA